MRENLTRTHLIGRGINEGMVFGVIYRMRFGGRSRLDRRVILRNSLRFQINRLQGSLLTGPSAGNGITEMFSQAH
jgi:hypothetical protein